LQTDRASAAHTIRRGHLRDLEIWVKGHSRSLETVPFGIIHDSLVTIYSRDI